MQRRQMQEQIKLFIEECLERDGFTYSETSESLLDFIEEYMKPRKRINPKAIADGFETDTWKGLTEYIDKYPEYHFDKGRPYEYYLEGWEEE